MQSDIDAAKAGIARAEALPDDAPHKATLLNHWRGELKMIRAHTHMDRLARSYTLRFYRAVRKAVT